MNVLFSARSLGRATLALVMLCGVALTGCGGGSGGAAGSGSRNVTLQTRNRVAALHSQSVRALALSGAQSASTATARNGAYSGGTAPRPPSGFGGATAGGAVTITAGASSTGSTQLIQPMPMVGAFINHVAATTPRGRAAVIARMLAHRSYKGKMPHDSGSSGSGSGTSSGGSVGGGGSTGGGDPTGTPTFYFDEYLGLWVDMQFTATQSTFNLYVDQGKTQPAGSIVTNFPSGNSYPQIYSSTWNFTAGLLQGAHGSYQTTVNQDNSGTASYADVNGDGSSDSGNSVWSGAGDYRWSDTATDANGGRADSTGQFHADGSGTTHCSTADGYTMDYIYNADGSGSGKITGPATGLPATVVWDIYGDTTITYADGTVDYTPGWIAVPATGVGGGVSGTTTTSSSSGK